jgi:hypothetical protein
MLTASCSDSGYGRSADHSCTLCRENPWLLPLFILVVLAIVCGLMFLILKAATSEGSVQSMGVLRVRGGLCWRGVGYEVR